MWRGWSSRCRMQTPVQRSYRPSERRWTRSMRVLLPSTRRKSSSSRYVSWSVACSTVAQHKHMSPHAQSDIASLSNELFTARSAQDELDSLLAAAQAELESRRGSGQLATLQAELQEARTAKAAAERTMQTLQAELQALRVGGATTPANATPAKSPPSKGTPPRSSPPGAARLAS